MKKHAVYFAVTLFTFIAMAYLCSINAHAYSLNLEMNSGGVVEIWHEEVQVDGSRYKTYESSGEVIFDDSTLYAIIKCDDSHLLGEVTYKNSTGDYVYFSQKETSDGIRVDIPDPDINLGVFTVTFVPIYSVTADDPDDNNGTIIVTGGDKVKEDDEVAFTVTADKGYRIDDVFIDGYSIGHSFTDENEYDGSVVVSANHEITATYVKETYDVNFSITSNSTEGKFFVLNENNGILCTLDDSNPEDSLALAYGDKIILKAEINDPDGLYIFSGFTVTAGAGALTQDDAFTSSFTVGDIGSEGDNSALISCAFAKEYVDIKFDIGKNGSITYTSPQGTVTVNSDNNTSYRSSADPFTFKATPDTSLFIVSSVVFTDKEGTAHTITSTNGTYSINKALGDGTLSVNFSDALSYNITVKAPDAKNCNFVVKADGVTLPTGTHRVSANSKLTISASTIDGSGYEFSYLSKDGGILSSSSSYTIKAPLASDMTLSAVFEEIETFKITLDYDDKMGEITQEGGLETGAKTIQVNKGERVTFTIDPESGYKIDSVNYSGSNISKSGDEYTTGKVTADAKLTVDFVSLTAGVTSIDVDKNGDTVVSLKGIDNVVEVADMYLGDILRTPMSKSGVLPTDVLKEIKNRNITLILDGKDYYWEIYGKNVINSSTNANLTVTIADGIIDDKFLGGIKNFADTTQFNIAYDGKLPFKGYLSIDVGDEHAGRYANLFYFDDSDFTLSRTYCVTIDKNGYATFPFSHASDYVIVIADKKLTASDIASADNVVFEEIALPTGGGSDTLKTAGLLLVGVLGVGIVIAIVIAVSGRRKYDDEDDAEEI